MIVAVIALGAALVLAIGVLVSLVYSNGKRVDQTIGSIEKVGKYVAEMSTLTLEAERAKYEAKHATEALNAERRRADALEEFISHDAIETDPAAPLAPDDVAGRILRFSRNVAGREAPAGDLPAGPDALMRPDEG